MAYLPPIKKRYYIGATETPSGKIVSHACSRCYEILPVTTKGVWFERADQPGTWVWVCGTCLDKRGIRH